MANLLAATPDGPESFKTTFTMRNQPILGARSFEVTRRVFVAPAIAAAGGGSAPPSSGQVWPRGSKA